MEATFHRLAHPRRIRSHEAVFNLSFVEHFVFVRVFQIFLLQGWALIRVVCVLDDQGKYALMELEREFKTDTYRSLYYLFQAANLAVHSWGAKKLSQVMYDSLLKKIVDGDNELHIYFEAARNFRNEGGDLYVCLDDTVDELQRKACKMFKLQSRIDMNIMHIKRMDSHANHLHELLRRCYL